METPSLVGHSLLVAESEGGCRGRLRELTEGPRHGSLPVGGADLPAGVRAEAGDGGLGVPAPALAAGICDPVLGHVREDRRGRAPCCGDAAEVVGADRGGGRSWAPAHRRRAEPAGQHGPSLAAPRRLASRVAAPARHGPRRRTRPTRTCRPACIRDRPSWALRLPALAAAMHATRRPLGPMTIPAWPLIVVLTGGRLLAPLRGS